MSAITRRFAVAPRLPWRLGLALALLIAAAIIGLIVAGSRLSKPAPPFGPAANGGIPYMSHGQLYIGDLESGNSRLLGDSAGQPHSSPDGTRISFITTERVNGSPAISLHFLRADGSDPKVIRPAEPIFDSDWVWMGWMPDSRHFAIIHPVNSVNQLDVFDPIDNAPVKRLSAAAGLNALAFRPPDGGEILFRAGVRASNGAIAYGLYVMSAEGSNVRPVAKAAVSDDENDFGSATYTPDGKRIFFNHSTVDGSTGQPGCCQLWVMNSDGSDQHALLANPGTAWDGDAAVSPDGTRVAFRHYPNDSQAHGLAVIRSDGTGPLIETLPAVGGLALFVWAPDSSKIFMYPRDNSNSPAYLLDPKGGPFTTTPWTQDNDIDWQRVALP